MDLSNVTSRYGAPMGRATYGHQFTGKLYVSCIRLDGGGYDKGGAYWGHGLPIYAASDTPIGDTQISTVFATCRAKDRGEALAHFRTLLPNASFHRP